MFIHLFVAGMCILYITIIKTIYIYIFLGQNILRTKISPLNVINVRRFVHINVT